MKIIIWVAGVIMPVLALAFEYFNEICRGAFYLDPIPTGAHVGLVLAVPATHLAWALGSRGRLVRFGIGVSLAICAAYCLLLLPMVPLLCTVWTALISNWNLGVLLICVLSLLGWTPYLALLVTIQAARSLAPSRLLRAGVGLGLAALLLANLPLTWTRHWMLNGDVEQLRRHGVRRRMHDFCLENPSASFDLGLVAERPHPARAEQLFLQTWHKNAKHERGGPYPGSPGHLFHPYDLAATPEPCTWAMLTIAAWLLRRRR